MSISNFYKRVIELLESISGGGGGGSGATEATLQAIDDKLPALSGGKIPVEVGSLNVTVDNANLEISNDVGNPVPASISSLPLPTGASTEATLSSLSGKIPTDLTVSSTRLLVDNGLVQALTDTQLRASAVPVTGSRSNAGSDTTSGKTHLTVGGSDGTNLRPLSVTSAGIVNTSNNPSLDLLQTFNLASTTNYSLTISVNYPCLLFEGKTSAGTATIQSFQINGIGVFLAPMNAPVTGSTFSFGNGGAIGYILSSGLGDLTFQTPSMSPTSPVLKVYGVKDPSFLNNALVSLSQYWLSLIETGTARTASINGKLPTMNNGAIPVIHAHGYVLTLSDSTITSAGTPTTATITSGAISVSIRMRYGTATVNGIVFNADEFNASSLNPNGDPRGFTWSESSYGKLPAISYTVDANSSMSLMVKR